MWDVTLANARGIARGDLLDVHAAFGREQHQRCACREVVHDGGIELALDVTAPLQQQLAHGVAVDRQREDVAGARCRFIGAVGRLDAARFAPLSGRHLRLHHAGTNLGEKCARLFRGSADATERRRDTGWFQDSGLGSVFEEVHAAPPLWPIFAHSGPNSSSSPGLSGVIGVTR